MRRARPLVAALAALAGAWTAAGSVGLLAHPLRHALVVLAVMAIIAAAWPAGAAWRRVLLLLAGGGLALAMSAAAMPVVTVLAVAVAADVAAAAAEGPARRLLSAVAAAVFAFAAYRLAVTAVPDVWLAADWVGGAMGRLAGGIAGRPLCVGATFGGVDFLVLMAAAYAAWLAAAPRPRWARAALGAAAILAANVLYLAVLAFAPAMEAAVELLPAPAPDAGVVSAPPWSWRAALGTLVPWNLPALGAAVELLVAGWMFRRTLGEGGGAPVPAPPAGRASAGLAAAAAVLAAAAGAAAVLPSGRCDLHGKKIVIYEKGFLNWLRPVHGEYGRMSAGMYGMLPDFLESLGAGCAVSPDLSEADLRGADAVVLLYPNEPWAAGQLERLGDFVRGGGTLLVMGEHTVREADGGCRFNDALGPTALRVRFDSATFAVGGWLASYEALLHPATAGLTDERNAFGVVIGASVDAPRPARPILVGRWGWADPGDPSAGESMMGNHRYDAGERLGDLVLAAEERLGAGKVIAFGDTSSLTNGITVGAHPFTSRLLAYAAERSAGPAPPWRDALVLVLAAALAAVVAWRPQPGRVVLAAAALAMAVLLSTDAAARAAEVLPDGRGRTPNNLAYIDTTHLEAAGEESWRPDGMMGLAMTLMREGCLVLNLREFTAERLVLAGLVVSVAPSRAFTLAERRAVREFIEAGGIFILTVGCDDAGPSSELLADLGFRIGEPSGAAGAAPARDPEPLGHFKWPYLGAGEGAAHVRFHSAWPVSCGDAEARVIARGADDLPVIVMRRVGRGKAVVIGDTCFAMNKNLENESGDPIEGMRENADFWRWFLRILRDQEAAP
ncbi:MAG: hypothetical protein FJ288_15490 [Planctomycetes bacterium]|nr:hypothetical protein [Planctomycetota bacterium]